MTMTAAVECAVCGAKLFFDTRAPISPENEGWMELPVGEISVKMLTMGRNEIAPVCPNCRELYTRIAQNYDPFST